MTDQHTITRLHDQLAAANAEIARLSAHIVARNIGECVCGNGLGERREGATGWTVAANRAGAAMSGSGMAGDFGCGYGGTD